MRFSKILCTTDFSPGSRQAVALAVRLAQQTGGELVIAHAWTMPPSAYTVEAPFPPYALDEIVEHAQRALDGAVADARAAGASRVTGRLLRGPAWDQIVATLAGDAYDLCVIGTHGRTGLKRLLLGSVAEMVVRHAPCSVLAVRADGDVKPFHHALVPTDFSASAELALDAAAALVEPPAALTLLHVLEIPVAYTSEPAASGFTRDLDRYAGRALDKELSRVRTNPALALDAASRIGHAAGQILATADEDRTIDLVVMGSHGRTGIKRALLGSVAERVVRHARCPVLVIRARA